MMSQSKREKQGFAGMCKREYELSFTSDRAVLSRTIQDRREVNRGMENQIIRGLKVIQGRLPSLKSLLSHKEKI